MYAILQHGGHQYRVGPGDRLLVNRLDAEVGTVVALEPVLFVTDGDGKPGNTASGSGARVAATVVSHRRGTKLRVFRYKPKKRYRRTMGYRSQLTELLIGAVVGQDEKLPPASTTVRAVPEKAPAAPVKRAARSRRAAAEPEAATAEPEAATPEPKAAAAEPSATAESAPPASAPKATTKRKGTPAPDPEPSPEVTAEAAPGESEGAGAVEPKSTTEEDGDGA